MSRDRNRERRERQQHEQAMDRRASKKTSPEQGEKIGPATAGPQQSRKITTMDELEDYL